MTLFEELSRKVEPFYNHRPNGSKPYHRYDPDRDGERYCSECKGWKKLNDFRDYGHGKKRHCKACECKLQKMRGERI